MKIDSNYAYFLKKSPIFTKSIYIIRNKNLKHKDFENKFSFIRTVYFKKEV